MIKRTIAHILERNYTLKPLPIIYRALDKKMRRQLAYMYLCMLGTGAFEMLVIAAIGLFVSSASNPDILAQSSYIKMAEARLHITDVTPVQLQTIFGLILITLQLTKMVLRSGTDYIAIRYSALVDTVMGERLMAKMLALEYQDTKVKYNQADIFNFVSWRTFFGTDYLKGGLQALQSSTIAVILFSGLAVAYPLITFSTFSLFALLGAAIYKLIGPSVDKAVNQYADGSVDVSARAGMIFSGLREIKLAA